MATAYKVLGQTAPAATSNADVYTVPSSKYAVVSTITVANRGTGDATYRIAVRPNGATIANEHYIAYDAPIPGNDTVGLTLGLTADASDVFTVYGSSADLSFNIFGSEIDA